MAKMVKEYRGFQLWRTWRTVTYTKTDGTTSKSTQGCYHAIHKEGKYPPIKHPSGGCWRQSNVEKRIDEALLQPPAADSVYEPPADAPREVDTYQGVAIYYHPDRGQYYAKVAGHGKYVDTPDEAHAFIDHEQYINSPIYQEEKARKKAEQDAALERARIYGIGTDEYGDEIPPTDEEIAARETYYAKVRVSGADTVREQYERAQGIEPTVEEIELREEYQGAELEAQGKWLDLFRLKLKAEWRNLMELIQ